VLTLLDRNPERPDADQDIQSLSLFADQAALAVEAVRAFEDVGRVLLGALAIAADGEAAGTRSGLGRALEDLADTSVDADLVELAALFAGLTRTGTAERELAVRMVRDVLRYTRQRAGA
jgi:GAF domain-containing protein